MQRFIVRDVIESDKRVETNWWLKEPCEYCLRKNSEACDYCIYKRKIL